MSSQNEELEIAIRKSKETIAHTREFLAGLKRFEKQRLLEEKPSPKIGKELPQRSRK